MFTQRIRRAAGAALLGLLPLLGVTAFAGTAQGHGWTQNPASRQDHCASGAVTGCGEIQWEPQSVEGPKGFPASGPADGTICAGGNGRFSQLDDPRGAGWPTTPLTSGANHEFRWQISVSHATSSWRYFVTRDGWNPNQPLSRAQLEPAPFLSLDYGGQRPPSVFAHSGTLPNKSGHHVILAVWDIADTGNAFYACSDVRFS
ncbi:MULTISPECIES: lytic polysaccharide monooxygenase auxiliary activity family 9 protein [Actinoalloteichus]|uniref:Chitin-binding protein n=1 Tax=Actinoalloteichus caeruleus DSM 43889 TaxID=1120930 RepID=A0ABT1JPE3_ACTCY|nr:lytic polysaccharide monooxygenase [Actinoalloteichus caeruleus]MCP2333551.1 chitin-binding protein [Actinoalloteichus caeruleus DSM 43889]